jgi:hypothetical protein
MKVWSEFREGSDGKLYSVRLLLTDEEARHMQSVGCLGPLWHIVGMQPVADSTMAQFEKEAHTAGGGVVQ